MMGKTHVAMGIASAMLILHPVTTQECIVAVVGGALGGVAADIDTVKNDYKYDALIGQLLAYSIFVVLFLLDLLLELGLCRGVLSNWGVANAIGIAVYILLLLIGFFTPHRTFTHSLLSMALFALSVALACPPLLFSYLIGYASHLLLDILNKKDVPLLYPMKKGICLKWFYAGKTANTIFMWVGVVSSLLLIANVYIQLW